MYMFQSKHKLKRYFKSFKLLQISQGGSLEDEAMASKKTEEFNKILGKHGNDVATWIKYVEFQVCWATTLIVFVF